jgi:hypothetical protein
MKIAKITLIVVCMLCVSVFAQSSLERKDLGTSGDAIGESRIDNKFSLFDLSRLEMRQSYSVSYFSGNGSGQTIGMYMNSIRYRISNPLTISIDLLWMHEPGQLFSQNKSTPTDYGSIFPSFRLEYRPSDKFYLEVGYQRVPSYMYYDQARSYPGGYWDRHLRQK